MIAGIIPARLGSTRFPRKILADIAGKPMLIRVAEQAAKATLLDRVIVAVDDPDVAALVANHGFEALLTAPDHPSGTDRVAEVARKLKPEIVINIQGDEPRMDPDIIDGLVQECERNKAALVTAVSTDLTPADFMNPNVVKARLDAQGRALTFLRDVPLKESGGYYRHLGMYGYSGALLERFTALPPSEHERQYRLEQWRALDHDLPVVCIITNYPYRGIDTPEDLNQLGPIHDSDETS